MMRHSEARNLIPDGALLAWTHDSWETWTDIQVQFVRMMTRSEYSHCAVAHHIHGRLMIFEAVGGGTRFHPLSLERPYFWLRGLPIEWNQRAADYAFERLGQPYSRWQAVMAELGWLQGGQDSKWECCEYALSIVAQCNFVLCDERGNPVKMVPTDVVRAAQRMPGVEVVYVE